MWLNEQLRIVYSSARFDVNGLITAAMKVESVYMHISENPQFYIHNDRGMHPVIKTN